jgi:hypothetical protein
LAAKQADHLHFQLMNNELCFPTLVNIPRAGGFSNWRFQVDAAAGKPPDAVYGSESGFPEWERPLKKAVLIPALIHFWHLRYL